MKHEEACTIKLLIISVSFVLFTSVAVLLILKNMMKTWHKMDLYWNRCLLFSTTSYYWKCKECDYKFSDLRKVKKHQRRKHDINGFLQHLVLFIFTKSYCWKCKECDYEFKDLRKFKKHQWWKRISIDFLFSLQVIVENVWILTTNLST